MNKIKILIEGYAKQIGKGWRASSTCCLITSGNKKIITDPGCNRKALLKALKKEKIKTSEIDFVLVTHCHLDHSLLSGIFEKAKILTPEEIYNKDKQTEQTNKIAGTNLKISKTPGHMAEHCSLIVPTKEGAYAIAGDCFWWTENEKQKLDIGKKDEAHPSEVDLKKLVESRKKILKMADYVIPGHGKMFKTKK